MSTAARACIRSQDGTQHFTNRISQCVSCVKMCRLSIVATEGAQRQLLTFLGKKMCTLYQFHPVAIGKKKIYLH